MMLFFKAVHVCLRAFAFALQIFSTGEARICVQVDKCDRAHLLKVEIEDMSLDLSQIWTVPSSPLALSCLPTLTV